jgi:helix-turn-helix protein
MMKPQTVPDDHQVLTIPESAKILRCSRVHVQNLLLGKVKGVPPLPHIPMGRRKLIRKESLEKWMAQAEAKLG